MVGVSDKTMDPKDADSLKTVQFYTTEDVPEMKVPSYSRLCCNEPGQSDSSLVPIEYFIGGERRPQILLN